MIETAELWDWRRRIADLYAQIRAENDPEAAWHLWRTTRDHLFATHPQSPIEPQNRAKFQGIPLYPYNPAFRFLVDLTPTTGPALHLPAGQDGTVEASPFALTNGLEPTLGKELTLYWLAGYGGGVFLPFTDATSGQETYGGGRYILDTIKSADLGRQNDRWVIDFNFAYTPSCAYSDRYVCPLASPASRVTAAVRSGERMWRRT